MIYWSVINQLLSFASSNCYATNVDLAFVQNKMDIKGELNGCITQNTLAHLVQVSFQRTFIAEVEGVMGCL